MQGVDGSRMAPMDTDDREIRKTTAPNANRRGPLSKVVAGGSGIDEGQHCSEGVQAGDQGVRMLPQGSSRCNRQKSPPFIRPHRLICRVAARNTQSTSVNIPCSPKPTPRRTAQGASP